MEARVYQVMSFNFAAVHWPIRQLSGCPSWSHIGNVYTGLNGIKRLLHLLGLLENMWQKLVYYCLQDMFVKHYALTAAKQNRSTEGCSKLKRSVDMTSSGRNGLNIRTNAQKSQMGQDQVSGKNLLFANQQLFKDCLVFFMSH